MELEDMLHLCGQKIPDDPGRNASGGIFCKQGANMGVYAEEPGRGAPSARLLSEVRLYVVLQD